MHDTDDTTQGQRLHRAIRAALEAASRTGRLVGSTHEILESTLARLDEKLGQESTGVHYRVQHAPHHCVMIAHTSDPDIIEVVASFMHHAGATTLGSSKAWLLPLDGIPVNRWIRAIRRVLAAEQRIQGDADLGFAVSLTAVWAQEGELVVSNIG